MRKHTTLLILALVGLLAGGVALVLTHSAVQAQSSQSDGERGIQMSSPHFNLYWNVVGNGGGQIASAHFRVHSTIGQPAIGWKQSTSFKEHTGYWQPFLYRIYLPLVLRN